MAASLPAMLRSSPEPSLLAGGCPMKAMARRAYGAQLPNGDQRTVRCQDRLTAWHSLPEPPASGGKKLASGEGSFTQPGISAAGCAGAGGTWQLAVAVSGGFAAGSHAGGGKAALEPCPVSGKLSVPCQRVLGC